MQPKTTRQQIPQQTNNRPATQTRPMHVRHHWIKKPPKPEPPDPAPRDYRRCKSAQLNAANCSANQTPPKADYTSVYQNDFKQWEASKRQPYILKDSLTLEHGLGNLLVPQRETDPTGNTTSYKSDYVHHPAHPRPVKLKHSNQSSYDLPLEPRLPFKPKQAWSTYRDFLDEASDFYEKFNSCSLDTKFQGHTKDFTSPADHSVQCQVSVQNLSTSEKNDVPCQAATTMTEGSGVWDAPQSFTAVKPTLSAGKPKFTDGCKASPKASSRHTKINKTAGCNSTRDATRKPQRPAELEVLSGFECSSGNGASKMYWYGNLGRGGTQPHGDDCVDHTNQIFSCMASSRH
ncbi:uncharacterized protein LOC115775213 isoform X2 [Archocentrus centrarchus]|uniref:uncharacterized protein LOC115775213 isoform X2 n=1 Tax=Archocentrus centrarchus TaxID=63155 RepID=UPI0011EA28C1|nr:uncharacterized protein LOC115775213 isoform X2 [Archocentrus centrarchus]